VHTIPSRRRRLLASALALACACAQAQVGVSPQFDTDYVLLPDGARADGGTLVHDYGAFALWRVGATGRKARAERRIDLPSGWFVPRATDAAAAKAQRGTGVYVVQFVGPIIDAWLAELRRAGAVPLQYVGEDAYLVVADANAGAALAQMAARGEPLRYSAPLAADRKIEPKAAAYVQAHPQGRVRATIVVADHAHAAATRQRIAALDATSGERAWSDLRGMHALDIDVAASRIGEIAALDDVVTIGLAAKRRTFDEKQTQIVAGSFNATLTGPAAPGYRAWLESLGFSTNPADYPPLAVVDDGIGNGTTVAGAGDESLTTNGAGIESRVIVAHSCRSRLPQSRNGHGHMGASIAAGYDDRSGFPHRDPDGYRRREGANPWARLVNIQILEEGLNSCGRADDAIIKLQASYGARVSTNAWGSSTPEAGHPYDAESRVYDIGARDADPATAGSQPITFVFAAGNYGPDASSVPSPNNAKNVITVGASENQRPVDTDSPWDTSRCSSDPLIADNAMDIWPLSSRGPAVGGRTKPELVLPGARIYGSVTPSPEYTGWGACQKYHPDNQTKTTLSSGTSVAAPALAGAATLLYRYLETHGLHATPSPALIKAYLIAHPTYLTGNEANDTLPSPAQGYGMPNLGDAFATTTSRLLVDQTRVFGAAGETFDLVSQVADETRPVRVVLSWTDAPGAANAQSPLVNDLDLVVHAGGVAWHGNRFDGRWSVSGGDGDAANNTEAVYLPAGTSGPIRVTVTGRNIAGDGVPDNADATDQDFALVCTNCAQRVVRDRPARTRQVVPEA
jgi:hypothetical protein